MLSILTILTVFLPLLGFATTNLLKEKNKYGPYICTFLLIASFASSAVLAISLGFGSVHHVHLWTWFKVGDLKANWGFLVDALSLTMLLVVTLISALVHVYSFGYMHNDKHIGKFFSYLSFFTFTMLLLVSAPNLLQLFVGWEGVGLASYLLIGFWYKKESAANAGMKAFVVNRVGDVGLVAAIGFLFATFGSLDFTIIFSKLMSGSNLPSTIHLFQDIPTFELIGFCLLFGAMGKSAQFGLHTWLPDAMEGPTPVSALIHAATMVTAGIFLICRFSPIFEMAPITRSVMLIVGSLTAFFAASVALTQTDIKRIIAYSTCSQLGYMVMSCAVSAYSIAMFHLVTHAFFKALLFLGAGSVIHAMSGEQDITKMGGLYKLIPFTFATMMIGSLALAGIPIFAGFFSKDAIIEAIYISPIFFAQIAFLISILVVFLTAFYSWRLLTMTFHKETLRDEHVLAHIHESPLSMKIPLIVLSIGAIFSGFLGKAWYMDQTYGFKWGTSLAFSTVCHPHVPFIIEYIPLLLALTGIMVGYLFYLFFPDIPKRLSKNIFYKISFNKWYVDELYNIVFIKFIKKIGRFFWIAGDQTFIDTIGPDGSALLVLKAAQASRNLATGRINHMILAFVLLLILILGGCLFIPYLKGFIYHG